MANLNNISPLYKEIRQIAGVPARKISGKCFDDLIIKATEIFDDQI